MDSLSSFPSPAPDSGGRAHTAEQRPRPTAAGTPYFMGKHQMTAAISFLEQQQIQLIQEELDQLETLGESSIVCREGVLKEKLKEHQAHDQTMLLIAMHFGGPDVPNIVSDTLPTQMRKMMRDKALVRRLSACETMGSATTMCSDKTGTLTLNQITVVEACVGTKKVATADIKSILPPKLVSLLIEGIAQNTTCSVFMPEMTEHLIKSYCNALGIDSKNYRIQCFLHEKCLMKLTIEDGGNITYADSFEDNTFDTTGARLTAMVTTN